MMIVLPKLIYIINIYDYEDVLGIENEDDDVVGDVAG